MNQKNQIDNSVLLKSKRNNKRCLGINYFHLSENNLFLHLEFQRALADV